MIKALILFYLSIKPTHGYEIQKFIQVSGLDKWTKIQSGSIYYALAKLEKDKCIELAREDKIGSRIRKIYGITEKGREELEIALREELGKEIASVGSDKLFIYTMFNRINKDEMKEIIKKHIKELKKKYDYWTYWKDMKINKNSMEAEIISFDMSISSLEYQIKWHEAILKDIDRYIDISSKQEQIIKDIDFGELDEKAEINDLEINQRIQRLKEEIVNNPENAKEKIDELILMLKK